MISITDLNAAWNSIVPCAGQTVGRRADENHPLDFFVSYDENQNMQLVVLCDDVPSVPSSSIQILVRANYRQDGKCALCFSLSDRTLREQFIFLCWDIMACSYDVETQKAGIKKVITRFRLWQKLFAEAKVKRLADSDVKGLIGELVVLSEIIMKHHDPHDAITGWVGPLSADRDFEMSDTWYEAKAVSLSKDVVSISSLDQLDTDAVGHLVVVRIEKTSLHAQGHITLNFLIDSIRERLANYEDRVAFDMRITCANCDRADPRADEPYILHNLELYRVDCDFPRLRRTNLSTAISNAGYELNIPGLQRWRLG